MKIRLLITNFFILFSIQAMDESGWLLQALPEKKPSNVSINAESPLLQPPTTHKFMSMDMKSRSKQVIAGSVAVGTGSVGVVGPWATAKCWLFPFYAACGYPGCIAALLGSCIISGTSALVVGEGIKALNESD